MIIKIRFYGDLAREIGKIEESIELNNPIKIKDLLEKVLSARKIKLSEILHDYTILINGFVRELNYIINKPCEIKIIPLVRGGNYFE